MGELQRHYALAIIDFTDEPDANRELRMHEEISRADFERYSSALGALNKSRRTSLITYVEDALGQAEANVDMIYRLIDSRGPTLGSVAQAERAARTSVTSVLSVVSGFYMHQEHAESKARRVGGEELVKKVNDIYRREYDKKPWLYLMVRLRNVMAHYSTDVIRHSSGATELAPGSIHTRFTIEIDRDALAAVPNGINRKLREYLAAFEANPDALEVMHTAYADLMEIDREVAVLLDADLQDHAKAISELFDRYGPVPDGRIIMELGPDLSPVIDGQIRYTGITELEHRHAVSILNQVAG